MGPKSSPLTSFKRVRGHGPDAIDRWRRWSQEGFGRRRRFLPVQRNTGVARGILKEPRLSTLPPETQATCPGILGGEPCFASGEAPTTRPVGPGGFTGALGKAHSRRKRPEAQQDSGRVLPARKPSPENVVELQSFLRLRARIPNSATRPPPRDAVTQHSIRRSNPAPAGAQLVVVPPAPHHAGPAIRRRGGRPHPARDGTPPRPIFPPSVNPHRESRRQ